MTSVPAGPPEPYQPVVGVPPSPSPPPRGPGVTPPFPAPPVEGRSTRLWLGLGAAGLATVLCCGGGLAALIGLGVTGAQAINERAHVAVSSYLDDVRAGRYDDAYAALCPALRRQETADQFADRVADEPSISGYDMRTVSNPSELVLPVDVRYADGTADTLRFRLEQDVNTGEFEVCGIDR
ncbi:MAG TPA: hypothetical protein VFT95_10755 [Micromonosporaceae bacterium]|nr:hypothetical protein [Micromonosporaceae bacterium]